MRMQGSWVKLNALFTKGPFMQRRGQALSPSSSLHNAEKGPVKRLILLFAKKRPKGQQAGGRTTKSTLATVRQIESLLLFCVPI